MTNDLFGLYVSLVERIFGWMPRSSLPADVNKHIYLGGVVCAISLRKFEKKDRSRQVRKRPTPSEWFA